MSKDAGKKVRGKRSAPRGRPGRWLAGGLAASAILLGAAYLLAVAPAASSAAKVERFTHIHGLEVPAWAGGEVFVSTHIGLLRIDSEGEWYEVGDVKHDFMGFRAHPSEEGVLYSSGHPDLQSGLPNPIGFMVSRDAGLSWEPLALTGEVDFHAMTVQQTDGDVVYGFNVAGEAGLYRSFDGGHNWERVDSPELLEVGGALSLEVHPQDREALFAGTQAGLFYSGDGGRSWENVALQGVPVTAVRFAPGGAGKLFVYGAHPEARLLVSEDLGAS